MHDDTTLGNKARLQSTWDALQQMVQSGGGSDVNGAAAAHAHAARLEAASALVGNHARVLLDLTNPSETLNIDGKELTQRFTLRRLPVQDRSDVDAFLCEVARRLLGGPLSLAHNAGFSGGRRSAAWVQAAKYLTSRIQATPQQKAGRKPDMSVQAADAMKAVMGELGQAASPASLPVPLVISTPTTASVLAD